MSDPFTIRARARIALENHALQDVFLGLSLERQLEIANLADQLVDGVATATQNRAFLRGEPEEDDVATDAIFGNGLCALLRAEKASQARIKDLGDMIHKRGNEIAELKHTIKRMSREAHGG